ncbi:hypothetical protein BJ138DRAFT_1020994 [Hygrophoropsis aurantiaca]|uniref:Uncharacterized protein n=1 Tax=Hygrophoropsis aurantiaca TaxID=72124 RepID=A0ACB7ZQL8_9AGAM|nr:hypothetical protein BJ138DRAFT_1020994 [Hygrophoropsis aurantiaca]
MLTARLAGLRARAHARSYSTRNPDDFRPPWVYTASHLLTYTLIPSAILYCVFLADWGDRDHVFLHVRRWAAHQSSRFFSIDRDEAALASNTQSPPVQQEKK